MITFDAAEETENLVDDLNRYTEHLYTVLDFNSTENFQEYLLDVVELCHFIAFFFVAGTGGTYFKQKFIDSYGNLNYTANKFIQIKYATNTKKVKL